jgi:hypothetical protein
VISSDQQVVFSNGQKSSNCKYKSTERLFLQEFLEFYNSNILKDGEQFHYEKFYDFYSCYLHNRENEKIINNFYLGFKEKYFKYSKKDPDCYNMVSDFNRSFNQLLAELLHKSKYFNDISFFEYPPYDSFINFLRELLKSCDVKVHTLNHDLFFDFLGRNHSDLYQHFADGYSLEGSPFYGEVTAVFNSNTEKEVTKRYYVKLEQFINKFDKPLCLFKLHGSISNMIVYSPPTTNENRIRLKNNYAVSNFLMEKMDEKTGKMKLENIWDEVAPDFLSGTTNKIRFYKDDTHYKSLFEHFKKNLANSELLIVIGYGFQDIGINNYLKENYLSKNKPMVVIDPCEPKAELVELIDKYQCITPIKKDITKITYKEYLKLAFTLSHKTKNSKNT